MNFYKEAIIHQLVFASWRYLYVNCYSRMSRDWYRMGPPRSRDVSRTHSLFIDDLKVYQESHEILRDVNGVIVQASHDTGACYRVSKCAKIVFEHDKMVMLEVLEVMEERMKAIEPDKTEI